MWVILNSTLHMGYNPDNSLPAEFQTIFFNKADHSLAT